MQLTRPRVRKGTEHAVVSPLELFFDLVFVFALTQVTAYLAAEPTGQGVLRGVLLWWAWTGYAWLANVVSAEEGPIKLIMLVSMATMFLVALCIPEAFDDAPGGLSGPTVVAVCYLVFRLMHLVLFFVISQDDPGLRGQLLRFTPSVLGSTALLLVAGQLEGAAQTALWAAALAVDYVGTALGGASGWRLPAPDHFAERHGLITIVALGESIVAIGVGVAERPISAPIIVASVAGLVLASAMWWAYFDVSALQGEHALSTRPIEDRARLGRNAFSFAHLPLVTGIVLVALGLKKVLEYVSDSEHHGLEDPLKGLLLLAFYGGLILYLLAHVMFKWLTVHHLSLVRLVCAGVLAAAIPVVAAVPALGQLVVAAAVVTAAVIVEAVLFAESRREVRTALAHH